jgi:hypothetical protein
MSNDNNKNMHQTAIDVLEDRISSLVHYLMEFEENIRSDYRDEKQGQIDDLVKTVEFLKDLTISVPVNTSLKQALTTSNIEETTHNKQLNDSVDSWKASMMRLNEQLKKFREVAREYASAQEAKKKADAVQLDVLNKLKEGLSKDNNEDND